MASLLVPSENLPGCNERIPQLDNANLPETPCTCVSRSHKFRALGVRGYYPFSPSRTRCRARRSRLTAPYTPRSIVQRRLHPLMPRSKQASKSKPRRPGLARKTREYSKLTKLKCQVNRR